jgi:hypothetical protein
MNSVEPHLTPAGEFGTYLWLVFVRAEVLDRAQAEFGSSHQGDITKKWGSNNKECAEGHGYQVF